MRKPPRARSVALTAILAALSLVATAGSPPSRETAAADRLSSAHLHPTAQTIRMRLDPSGESYEGSVAIELEVVVETDRFRFHSVGQTLDRVELFDANGAIGLEVGRAGSSDELVTARTARMLSPGTYRLEVDYSASFGAPLEGLYRVERGEDHYVFSVFQPIEARRAFPCWDEPEFKIPFRVELTVPDGLTAISTGGVEEESEADGWRTVRFRETAPLPSYAVAFAIGPFDTVEVPGVATPTRLVTRRGAGEMARHAAPLVAETLEAVESYFGQPYPYDKLDLLAVPDFPGGGLENAGAITFSEDILLLEPGAALSRRRNQAELIAHELAHMWFGNLVTLKWWDDVWLNESFATWMSYKIVDQVRPGLRIEASRQRAVARAFELDAQAGAPPIRREFTSPNEAFTVSAPLTYAKGSQVLAMAERWVGEAVFREGILAYFGAHEHGNAEGADFWRAIDRAAGRPVSESLGSFMDQPGYPRVDLARGENGWIARQERFVNVGAEASPQLWRFPVGVVTGGAGARESVEVLLGADPPGEGGTPTFGTLSTPPFPNADAAGYYRWSLPREDLLALASGAAERLNPAERLDLVANAAALLGAGELSGDAYLQLLGSMIGDHDAVVVGATVAALDHARTALATPDLEEEFAAYLGRSVGPTLDRLGFEPGAGESEHVTDLRARLYLLAGTVGRDEAVRAHAAQLTHSYLAPDPKEGAASVPAGDPTLIAAALKVAARTGDRELFEAYLGRLGASKSPGERRNLVEAMAGFPQSAERRAALDGFLDGTLDIGELMTLAAMLLRDEAAADDLWSWLTEGYDELRAVFPPFMMPFLPLFAGGCSEDRLAEAEAFFGDESRRIDGVESQLAQVAQRIRDCVDLREREGAVVARYLRER